VWTCLISVRPVVGTALACGDARSARPKSTRAHPPTSTPAILYKAYDVFGVYTVRGVTVGLLSIPGPSGLGSRWLLPGIHHDTAAHPASPVGPDGSVHRFTQSANCVCSMTV
jgi:hypothetical protein